MITPKDSAVKSFAQRFMQFVDASPTPFHCVKTAVSILDKAGFTRLHENEAWAQGKRLEVGGKYYYTRNDSCLIAFCVGGKFRAGNAFKVVGAHSDSPVLKLKPHANRNAFGFLQLGVECYGGGLWHTWLDRDLGIAGRVVVKENDNRFKQCLVHLKRPILRVPSLCIHLQTDQERKALELNKEDHLTPILGLMDKAVNKSNNAQAGSSEMDPRYPSDLLIALAGEIGCQPSQIVDVELTLFDTQPPSFGGINEEFIFSPRIDNQCHSFTSISALAEYASMGISKDDEDVSIAVLFDHEEVGSATASGAGSPIMRDAVVRISACFSANPDDELFKIGLSKSILFSADAAHGIHPNYSSKHEKYHQPKLGEGTVIKTNSNQRYATNSTSGFIVRELARRHGLPIQEFVVRNDCPCGSTIGPIVAANTGIRTVDIGIPQLSMHSIRETCSSVDLYTNFKLLLGFFTDGRKVDASLVSSNF